MTEGSDLRLVAGLGNPGPAYARTRHNLGFMVLDELLLREGAAWRRLGQADQATTGRSILLKPARFMNLSGRPIQAALTRARLRPGQLLVVHDDLDLPFGRMRFRFGGSAGGQRGVQDTIAHIGKDFWRLKLGIGAAPAGFETRNWVLSRFGKDELDLLDRVVGEAADAVSMALNEGPEAAANAYNGLVIV